MSDDTFSVLKSSGSIMWGEWGAWPYDEWTSHNKKYFGGELKHGGIVWGLTPHGYAMGLYDPGHNIITLHTMIAEKGNWHIWEVRGDVLFASDVLIHEMMHQHIEQAGIDGKEVSTHNSEAWASEINRIAPLLGLDVKAEMIKRRRIKGKGLTRAPLGGYLSGEEMEHFPHLQRPANYYGGYWGGLWEKIREERNKS